MSQWMVFIEAGAILFSAAGVIATLIVTSRLARRRADTDRRIAQRRATLDLLLLEQTKPEWIEQRRDFNKLCREQKGDLSKWATQENINTDNDKTALINAVLNQYELVSIGIREGIMDEDSYRVSCRTTFVKDWRACKPFVAQIRQTTENPALYVEFEKLARSWANAQEKPHV